MVDVPDADGPPTVSASDWFAEPAFAGYQQRYHVLRQLYVGRSAWQSVQVLELESYGRALVLEGTLQTSERDEFAYHEPLVHVPLFAHPNPRSVLIVGGGDGGALRHALLHPTVERVVESEIDGLVVEVSTRYLPAISRGAYDDPRAELRVEDGVQLMRQTSERFDVILVDSTDPVGPAAALISDAFLQAARGVLSPGGLMVMQSGSPLTQPREWCATLAAFRRAFPLVRPYLGWVPIYPGILWSWVAGSNDLDPASTDDITIAGRLAQLPEPLRLYSATTHRAAFALPPFLQELATLERVPTTADLLAVGHPLPGVIPAT